MVQVGYALSSEEHSASELVRLAAAAEEAGFDYAMISNRGRSAPSKATSGPHLTRHEP